jgi:hypothetical protein
MQGLANSSPHSAAVVSHAIAAEFFMGAWESMGVETDVES